MSDRHVAKARSEVAVCKVEARYLVGGDKALREAKRAYRRAVRRYNKSLCRVDD